MLDQGMSHVIVGRSSRTAEDAGPGDDREDHEAEGEGGNREYPFLGSREGLVGSSEIGGKVLRRLIGGRFVLGRRLVEADQRVAWIGAHLSRIAQHPPYRHRR